MVEFEENQKKKADSFGIREFMLKMLSEEEASMRADMRRIKKFISTNNELKAEVRRSSKVALEKMLEDDEGLRAGYLECKRLMGLSFQEYWQECENREKVTSGDGGNPHE